MSAHVGIFYVPDIGETEGIPRIYSGYGDPNELPKEYFVPPPRPGDRYMQLDTDPIVEWIFTTKGIWYEKDKYDNTPPDLTDIESIVKGTLPI
jgi:hypothetical protein